MELLSDPLCYPVAQSVPFFFLDKYNTSLSLPAVVAAAAAVSAVAVADVVAGVNTNTPGSSDSSFQYFLSESDGFHSGVIYL